MVNTQKARRERCPSGLLCEAIEKGVHESCYLLDSLIIDQKFLYVVLRFGDLAAFVVIDRKLPKHYKEYFQDQAV